MASVLLVIGGCSGSGESSFSPSTTAHEIGPASTEVLGGLTISVEFDERTVEAGDRLPASLSVVNNSGHIVTDPGCVLANTETAIIPVEDPGAELWLRTMTDCGGPFDYPVGYEDEYTSPTFIAATSTGEPLSPGDYIAAMEVDGQRLEYPVTVIEQVGEPDPLRGL